MGSYFVILETRRACTDLVHLQVPLSRCLPNQMKEDLKLEDYAHYCSSVVQAGMLFMGPPLSESSSFLTYCHRFIIYDPYIVVDLRYLYQTKARSVHIALKKTENFFKYSTSYLRIFFPACILRLILHVSEQQA